MTESARLAACGLVLGVFAGVAFAKDPPCDAFVVASGTLSSASFDPMGETDWAVESVVLSVHPDSIARLRLREWRDKPVEILVRPIAPRALEKVERDEQARTEAEAETATPVK